MIKASIFRIIDKITVYGKSEPLSCYEVINSTEDSVEVERLLVGNFNEAFDQYSLGNFQEAKNLFLETEKLEPDRGFGFNPSNEYVKRCDQLISNPPLNWDGTWMLSSK